MSGAVVPVKRRDPWINQYEVQAEAERAEVERRTNWKLRTTWWQRHEARRLEAIEDEKRKALLGKGVTYF
jgi:hypothetical protein